MNDVSRETVAAEVRAQIARQRRSGRNVALELGWTQNYMWKRLAGVKAFDVEDLAAIAKVLDVPVTVFFEQGGQLRKELLSGLAVAA